MNKRVPWTEKDEENFHSVFHWKQKYNESVDKWVKLDSQILKMMRENDALKVAVAEEREACCKIVYGQCESDNVAQRTVDAIRARGEV